MTGKHNKTPHEAPQPSWRRVAEVDGEVLRGVGTATPDSTSVKQMCSEPAGCAAGVRGHGEVGWGC